MARDAQRARVYAAEEFVRSLFDRAQSRSGATVDFFGTTLTLPPEARFGSVASVRAYVDGVLGHPAVRERWPDAAPLAVRNRRGSTAAHYEVRDGRAAIAVPDGGAVSAVAGGSATWALRELVVLHEIAHHLCGAEEAHGPEFVATFTDLADAVMGPEVGYVLRVVYAKEGVR